MHKWIGPITFVLAVGSTAGGALSLWGWSRSLSADASGWRGHVGPGYAVEVPAEWHVAPDSDSGRLEIAGAQGERMIVWRLRVDGERTTVAATLPQLARTLWPDVKWTAPESTTVGEVRMQGSAGFERATCVLSWDDEASTAVIQFTRSRAVAAAENEARFARVRASFRLIGARARRPQPQPQGEPASARSVASANVSHELEPVVHH